MSLPFFDANKIEIVSLPENLKWSYLQNILLFLNTKQHIPVQSAVGENQILKPICRLIPFSRANFEYIKMLRGWN